MRRDLRLAALEEEVLDLAEELAAEVERLGGDAELLDEYRAARAKVDDYCSDCGGSGVTTYVHGAGSFTCDPADIRERPCEACEPGRIIQAQRDADEEACAEERATRSADWLEAAS